MEISEASRRRELESENSKLQHVLAECFPRCGHPTLHGLLRIERLLKNPMRTYQFYREEGLQLLRKRLEKLARPQVSMTVPARVNERRRSTLCLISWPMAAAAGS